MQLQMWREKIEDLLEQQTRWTQDLREALDQECEALARVDPAGLDSASADKRKCIAALDELETERKQLCSTLGYTVDANGMQCLLSDLGGDNNSLAIRWDAMLAKLAECRNVNRVNGSLVAMQRHQVSAALALLRGGDDSISLYDPKGQTLPSARGMPIARA